MTLFILLMIAFCVYYIFIYKTSNFSLIQTYKSKKCPNCKNIIEKEFNVCPICKETLKKSCVNCREKIDVHWSYCPYCQKRNDNGISR